MYTDYDDIGTVRCHGCGKRVDDWDDVEGDVYCLRCSDPDTSPGGYDDVRDERIDKDRSR